MANQQGWNQQTPAVQSMLGGAMGAMRRTASRAKRAVSRVASRVRRKTARASGAKRSARSSSNGKRPARLVKGSAAAKAYMAKIRKLRK